MSLTLVVEYTNPAVPLALTISQEGVGGVTGKMPNVRVRDGATTHRYLDWADSVFKTGGWLQKDGPLVEVERGHYQRLLNLSLISGLPANTALVAEYHVDDGGDVVGDDHDILLLVDTRSSIDLLRKALTNRLEESPGNPGMLVLYDDDGTTPLKTWQLRDAVGGPTVATVGAPARRSAAV